MLMERTLWSALTVGRSIQSRGFRSARHRAGRLIRDQHYRERYGQKQRQLANPHMLFPEEGTEVNYHSGIYRESECWLIRCKLSLPADHPSGLAQIFRSAIRVPYAFPCQHLL